MAKKSFFEKNKMWIIIGILVLILVVYPIGLYNSFVSKEQTVMGEWSEVENQYQRQSDLIPNLVNSVKGYKEFEQGLLTEITELRSQWQTASSSGDTYTMDQTGSEMTSALSRLLLVYENYPDLKTIESVSSLMDELSGTQNRIAVARGRYIDAVKNYNIGIKKFPAMIIAGMFGFEEIEYYTAEEGSMETPVVDLG